MKRLIVLLILALAIETGDGSIEFRDLLPSEYINVDLDGLSVVEP